MRIPVSVSIKYKNYPYAPKATNASRTLGFLFTWLGLLVTVSLWFALVFIILASVLGPNNNASYIVAFVSVIPMCLLLFRWKKAREAKIDEAARIETAKVMSMTSDERAQYDAQLRGEGKKKLWIILGVLIAIVAIVQIVGSVK